MCVLMPCCTGFTFASSVKGPPAVPALDMDETDVVATRAGDAEGSVASPAPPPPPPAAVALLALVIGADLTTLLSLRK